MPREHHPHVNQGGVHECAYAGCGKHVPPDHFLCVRHYARFNDGHVMPCPGEGCKRFKSAEYERCADCAKAPRAESDPAWDAGDLGCGEFYAYLLLLDGGEFYAGHTRDLRCRLWEHQRGKCRSTSVNGDGGPGQPPRLVWFERHPNRAAAAERERELKLLMQQDRRAALAEVMRFQDLTRLVSPLL